MKMGGKRKVGVRKMRIVENGIVQWNGENKDEVYYQSNQNQYN